MRTRRARRSVEGAALLTALCVTATLGALAYLLGSSALRSHAERRAAEARVGCFHAAEAGLSRACFELRNGGEGAIGSPDDPARIGGIDYWVTADALEGDMTSLVATARDGSVIARHQLLVQDERDAVQDFAVFAAEQVTLRRNSLVDSYDSTRGSYQSQVRGDHAREDGNVGSNDDIEVEPDARVYGTTQHGPDDDDSITLAPAILLDGFGAALRELRLLPLSVPSHPVHGSVLVRAGQPQTIGPGAFELANLIARRQSRLTVRGPCELVVTTNVIFQSGSTWVLDTTDGPIRIYALGNFRLGRDATVRTTIDDPARLTFFLAGTHDAPDDRSPAIAFSADAQLYGTIDAPGLSVELESGVELYGSVKARWVELGSGARVHFDEELACGSLDQGPSHGIIAWRRLTSAPAAAVPIVVPLTQRE